MQRVLRLIYPPTCLGCGELIDTEFSLCGGCWRDTHFISGAVCDCCGAPLIGDEAEVGDRCDACLTRPRSWSRGRAAVLYKDKARDMVLALKHGDRADLSGTLAQWMARAGRDIFRSDVVLVPVPLHRFRLLRRRYNQSALLAHDLAKQTKLPCCPDALLRTRRTQPQSGPGYEARLANLADAIAPNPRRMGQIADRVVLLIDDVMTSGATLEVCAQACRAAGARDVYILTLARVARDT